MTYTVWAQFNTRDDGTGNTHRLSKHVSPPFYDLLSTDHHLLRVSFKRSLVNFRARIAQSVKLLATGWTVRGSNTGGGEIFHTRTDQPRGPPSLLYNGYRVSFPGVKRPGRGVDHPPTFSAEVKERVVISPLPLCAFLACSGVNVTFTFTVNFIHSYSHTEYYRK
jgi:hypothetical protein